MFELERLRLEQEQLEDSMEKMEYEFTMNKKEYLRDLKYSELQWVENKLEISKLVEKMIAKGLAK
jgi:hypothetical protein